MNAIDPQILGEAVLLIRVRVRASNARASKNSRRALAQIRARYGAGLALLPRAA